MTDLLKFQSDELKDLPRKRQKRETDGESENSTSTASPVDKTANADPNGHSHSFNDQMSQMVTSAKIHTQKQKSFYKFV